MVRYRLGAAVLTAVVVLSTAVALSFATPASARGVNPNWNIPISTTMSDTQWYFGHTTCERAPAGNTCENAMIRALNRAREALGKRKYNLPARFNRLTSAEQLLVLVNDDRRVYGRQPVLGMNAKLNAGARAGAKADRDPAPVGGGWRVMTSNWAGGMASPLFAYYGWMYADGLNRDGTSSNLDCTKAHRSGCWGHRDNVLLRYGRDNQTVLGIGRASTSLGPSWTQLFQAYPLRNHIGYIPTITSVSPRHGSTHGGTSVTIRGYGFFRVSKVQFGTSVAKVSHTSGTRVVATTTAHRKDVVYAMVTTAGGHSNRTGAAAYAYR